MNCYYMSDIRAAAKSSSVTGQVFFIYDKKAGWIRDEWAITPSHLYRNDLKKFTEEISETDLKKRIDDMSYHFALKKYLKSAGIPEDSSVETVIADLAKRSHSALPKGDLRSALNACAGNYTWGKYYFGAPSALCRDFIGLNFFYLIQQGETKYQNAINKVRDGLQKEMQQSDWNYINKNAPRAEDAAGDSDNPDESTTDPGKESGTIPEDKSADSVKRPETVYDRFVTLYQNKNYAEAKQLLQSEIDKILPQFSDTEELEYHDFRSAMQIVLYSYHYHPKKGIECLDPPISRLYSMYGSVLIEEGKLDEARGSFAKALSYNPTDFNIISEYMETFKNPDGMESFANLSRKSLQYAVTSPMVARVMRNMGFYFIETGAYQAAIACYQRSLVFEDCEIAHNELNYIEQKADLKVEPIQADQLRKLSEKYNFPIEADEDVVGLANYLGKEKLKDGETDAARYYYSVVYDLTGNDEAKKILDSLADENGEHNKSE